MSAVITEPEVCPGIRRCGGKCNSCRKILRELEGRSRLQKEDIAMAKDFTICNNCKLHIAGSMTEHKRTCKAVIEPIPQTLSPVWQAYLNERYPNRAERRAERVVDVPVVEIPPLTAEEDAWQREDYTDSYYDLTASLRAVGRERRQTRRGLWND